MFCNCFFFFSSRRRHTRWTGDWSSDVCSSDLLEPDQPKLVRAGRLEVDFERHEVRFGDARLQLRPKEFDLLALLARHPGRVFQRSELLDLVWGYDFPGYTRTVDVHVQQVREKLAAAEITDPSIQTVWGVGYRLELAGSGS